MRPIYRKLIEILATFAVGATLALTGIVWISSGITDENSQIAAACLGLVGCGISAMSLIAVAIIGLSSEKKWQLLCQKGEQMAAKRPVVEKIQDVAGEWRWRLRATNGRIIATGGEGYDSKFNVERAIDTVVQAFTECEIEADESE